jgi:hypothetical protein
MAMAIRVAGNKEGKGGKAMAMATIVAGGQTVTATRRAMAMATKEVGEEEGNGKGNKSDVDGKEDGNSKQ